MKKYTHKIEVLEKEDDISYYLLGAFMTDGCIILRNEQPIRAVLTTSDYEWAENIRNILSPNLPITNINGDGGGASYSLQINSKEICNWFISHGCIPRKSLVLKFPTIPKQYLPDFIRGCIDGDGSLGMYKYQKICNNKSYTCSSIQCYLCSASKDFIKSFEQYVKDNKYSYSYTERKPSKPKLKTGRIIISNAIQYKICISKNKDLNRFLSTIYYSDHRLSMRRKHNSAKELIIKTEKYLTRNTSLSETHKKNISNALLSKK